MAIDGHPETQRRWEAESPPQPQPARHRATARDSSRGRWWKLGLLAFGVVAMVGSAVALIAASVPTRETGSRLTHTITRGDMLITVIEQGTLESADNTEIKCKVRGYSTVTWVIESGTQVKPGDELVRLDTKGIEETASLQKTNVHIATATLEKTRANVARASIRIDAYLEGRFRQRVTTMETGVAIAQSNLSSARKMLDYSELLFKRGYVTELELEGNAFTVTQAELELKVKQTEIDVLKRFTKAMELESLRGNLKASKSKFEADQAGLAMDQARLARALEELQFCVVRSDRNGMVIYPSAAAWKDVPDITEGASVRKDQVLLLMPDLSQMQVKVGIHESIIDRIRPGLPARVTLPGKTLDAEVSSVASVTRPAGWWTGNVVKYDTIIQVPSVAGLKPGMSAEVEVIMARHENVLTIPVAAVVETEEGHFCWVKATPKPQRRSLQLGDSNDVFIIVEAGLKEGDEVMLNPPAFIETAQAGAMKTLDKARPSKPAGDSKRPAIPETDHGE